MHFVLLKMLQLRYNKKKSNYFLYQNKEEGAVTNIIEELPCIYVNAERFDLQNSSPMYPRKLVGIVSVIAGASNNLLHYCYSHTQMKVR